MADCELTLEKAIKACLRYETLKAETTRLSNMQDSESVHKMKMSKFKYKNPPGAKGSLKVCHFCAKSHELKKEKCPARDSVCRKCKSKGHWAGSAVCPEKSGAIYVGNIKDEHEFVAKFRLGNKLVYKALIDSGSGANTIGHDLYKTLHFPPLQTSTINLRHAGEGPLNVRGEISLKVGYPHEEPCISTNQKFIVIDGQEGIIIGRPAMKALGFGITSKFDDSAKLFDRTAISTVSQGSPEGAMSDVPLDLCVDHHGDTTVDLRIDSDPVSKNPSDSEGAEELLSDLYPGSGPVLDLSEETVAAVSVSKKDFDELCHDFNTVFDESTLREMKCQSFKIYLKDNAKPFACMAARNVALAYRPRLEKELDRMEILV